VANALTKHQILKYWMLIQSTFSSFCVIYILLTVYSGDESEQDQIKAVTTSGKANTSSSLKTRYVTDYGLEFYFFISIPYF
jgi:hypothetical protein